MENAHSDFKICRISLLFKDPRKEKLFQQTWRREMKKFGQMLLLIYSLYLICQSCSKPIIWPILALCIMVNVVAIANHCSYHFLAKTQGNVYTLCFAIVVSLISRMYEAETQQHSLRSLMKVSLEFIRSMYVFPLFGGIVLRIDFRFIVLTEVLVLGCLMRTLKVLSHFIPQYSSPQDDVTFLSQSLLGCLMSVTLAYFVEKHDRLAFVRNMKIQQQKKTRVKEKLQYQQDIWKAKGRYIAQVAHDIGTPLAKFSLAIEILRDLATTTEMKDIIETAQCAVDQMTVTRREALDHSKDMEGFKLQPSIKEGRVLNIIQKCARLMRHQLNGSSEKQFEFYLDPRLRTTVFMDGDWIWIMLMNYLSNAQKYSNGGKVMTTVFQPKRKEALRVEVSDNGIGVPAKNQHHLFKPFGQAMKCAGGTGLGLYGVYLKATALEGSVGFRTNPISATGSIFWFEVPCSKANEESTTEDLQPKRGSILFLGEWSLGLRARCVAYVENHFDTSEHARNVEQFRQTPELRSTPYSTVFWLLDEETVQKPMDDLVDVFKTMADIWATAWTPKRVPEIYISCEVLQQRKRNFVEISTTSKIVEAEFPRGLEGATPTPLGEALRFPNVKRPHPSKSRSRSSLFSSSLGKKMFKLRYEQQHLHRPYATRLDSRCSPVILEYHKNLASKALSLSRTGWKYERTPPYKKKRSSSDMLSTSSSGNKGSNSLPVSGRRPSSSYATPTLAKLFTKLENAIHDADCGVLIRNQLTDQDVESLVLKRQECRVEDKVVLSTTRLKKVDLSMDESKTDEATHAWCLPRSKDSDLSGTILLVDDDPTILKFVSRMIQMDKNSNYNVRTRINGFEALTTLKESEFEVACIDLNMPVMDGLECIRRFREWEEFQLEDGFRQRRQPIIMLSANAHSSHQSEAESTGADRFLAKPVKISELMRTINEIKCKDHSFIACK